MNSNLKPRRNFTEGPIFFRITLFALPIMLTGILQICYGMADNIIVGRFSGDTTALAAVGCTGSLSTLVINLLLGISSGAGVVISQLYGSNDERRVERAVHTSIVFALFGGIFMSILGLLISKPALVLMGTRTDVLDSAVLYFRIICLGIPANAVYNFGASVLRSTGDSKRPLIILSSTGLVNVLFNIIFVVCFGMTVDGVALATIISQYISAVAVIIVLISKEKSGECFGFSFKKLCVDGNLLRRILRYGVPAGLQSTMFNISNILLQSAVNTFPTTTVSANTIASNIDGIAYTTINSFSQAAMTFTGQNYGAKKLDRIKRVTAFTLIQTIVIGFLIGQIVLLMGENITSLYIKPSDPNYDIIVYTVMDIISLLLTTYFICGIMDCLAGVLRGMGYSIAPMLVSLGSICGIRVIWVFFVFPIPAMNTIRRLFISYPVSWSLAASIFAVLLIFLYKLEIGEDNALYILLLCKF